ncbi:hypothetical protein [Pendulispora albinea]|uniref:Uncharacterized protein n=1 Tax=Pendulispora albinea TaxID=2741071 RepID=A0ABZ2LPA3_9BACT
MIRPHITWLSLALVASAMALGGCSKRSHAKARANTQPVSAPAASEQDAQEARAPAQQHGSRKMKNVDVPVWLDGKQISVMRYGELPSTVIPRTSSEYPSAGARFYRIDEYLKAVGVPLERVRSVHMLGNRNKIGSIEGDELRAQKERFVFDFMTETSGIAKIRWSTTGLKNGYIIHEIRGLSVYVDKPSPAIDPKFVCHLLPGAATAAAAPPTGDEPKTLEDLCAAEDPYANGERAKGTRIYVDGKLAGYVKRRAIANSVVIGKNDGGDYLYSLTKFMASIGVDVASARSVELVSGDDLIVRASRADWMKNDKDLFFTLPKHQHGRVRVHIPAALQVQGEEPVTSCDSTVTAVLVHKRTPASTHQVVPVVDDPPEDGAVAARDNHQNEAPGSGEREN